MDECLVFWLDRMMLETIDGKIDGWIDDYMYEWIDG